MTSGLIKRVWEHKQDLADGFTKTYGVKTLVWFEAHQDVSEAIKREKQIKEWKREWKLKMIEQSNPYWRDLYPDIVGP